MTVSTVNVTLSAAAAAEIRAKAPAGGGLGLAVRGGGCSGFSYDMAFKPGPGPEDVTVERDGAKLYVDVISLSFLEGAELDWADELIGQSFKVKNPNARSSCGCGVSFSV